jgi:hypothetical protein
VLAVKIVEEKGFDSRDAGVLYCAQPSIALSTGSSLGYEKGRRATHFGRNGHCQIQALARLLLTRRAMLSFDIKYQIDIYVDVA